MRIDSRLRTGEPKRSSTPSSVEYALTMDSNQQGDEVRAGRVDVPETFG